MPEQQNIEYKQSWHDDYLNGFCGSTLVELKGEHNSRPRNPKIAKACFMAGYIDAWGRGTLKIYNSCKEHGLPEPDIMEKDGGFMVVLYKAPQGDDDGGVIGGQDGGVIGSVIGGVIGGVIDSLTDRQKDVLTIIKENNKASYKAIAKELSINESAVGDHIKALKEKGAIKRDGSTRGKWIILINI
ncbi:MAG: ATP-binding protein [Bacteroidales bacterium]|nr:ATP-binding protein [Bacteroidales bacterium]